MASVHDISDRYVDDFAAADPVTATLMGISGYDDRMPDYSPDGHLARAELARTALREVKAAAPADASEELAAAVITERVGMDLAVHEAGLDLSALNTIASPVQDMRIVFDLMPTDTTEHWETIAARAEAVPVTLDGMRASLLTAAGRGNVSALRQVSKVAEQAETWAGLHGKEGFFTGLVSGATGVDEALRARLDAAARAAQEAYAELAGFLRAELAPKAPTKDAVGEQAYRLWSRYFTGADLDPHEAYEWGWEEFTRIETEMLEIAGRIRPGASLAETAAALDTDERYLVHGAEAYERWMQQLSDAALESVRGTHFEIPDPIMALECRIAPPGGPAGAYYTGPNDDFTRPGTMWWSLPEGRDVFTTWREVSTVYHEGVPGHHLQIATAVHTETLNRFQRLLALNSGHAEGWALYAERLMRELGYLSDDGDLLGMQSEQLFRAARVIIDIGMHLELEIPAGSGFHPGQRWTPELGLEFLRTRTITDPGIIPDEIDRYLGWPGQAPSYKLGERLWLAARDEARARQGAAFDSKDFHTRALRMGGMGLDTLREQLAKLG
ncbi:DUF885 domain-containing protein [Amycolatopsis suaedae]|uniref:DUF885 domain-containing protein n=1 Tax=Amycolatopsis suaedae TaxID=2510978 RepID=A0A4Q7IZP2_9PSEU|nr:DUF885 domain-containing protein [Amycolatopsis suaedae]RZQ59979.1 DUF885 domain-containing protein [Amycolatopsis suaedae]